MHFGMDWNSVNFDWNRARAFLVTAEEGSLSAAARALGMAQPTLGRQVDALEQELGVVLFERVGRGLTLTPSGLELLDHVRAMGEAANKMSLIASGQSDALEGKVAIAASAVTAAFLLPPIIGRLRNEAPEIDIEIVTSNEASDLLRREADIAIRNFRPTEPELIAKKIGDVPARLYAAPSYLAKIGHPKQRSDLSHAEFIAIQDINLWVKTFNDWGFNLTGRNFPMCTENYLVMWEMVKAGLGIGVLDATIGDKEPMVERVLEDELLAEFPVWLVAHRGVSSAKRVRLVYDMLAEELGG